MDKAISDYMATIGRKGGKANKGKSSDKCRKAVEARWAKYRAQKAEENKEDTLENRIKHDKQN